MIYKVLSSECLGWFLIYFLQGSCFMLKCLYLFFPKNFTKLIPGTTVEILDQDSKNIIQLIVSAYNVSVPRRSDLCHMNPQLIVMLLCPLPQNIRSKVELTVWDHPEDISLAFTAKCQDGQARIGLQRCVDLKIGETVSRAALTTMHV